MSVAATYNNIAMVLDSQGQYEEALETYQKALDIKIKCLGLSQCRHCRGRDSREPEI